MTMFPEGRILQDRYDTRRLADCIEAKVVAESMNATVV